jgi:glycerol-3-phosphate cytidylyltransferase-like family protein
MKKDRIIVTCGKFDPINRDELDFLKKCKSKGDWLIVGIHSDWWMCGNNGGFFQSFETRREIVSGIKYVDEIFKFNDSDGTACMLLKLIKACYPNSNITFISEEDMHNMPETKIRGITFETMK